MKQFSSICVLLLTVGLSLPARASDKDLAEGFANAGVEQLAKGKPEARQQFYKALGYDSDCAIALHEVAKLMEAEGNNAAAAEFYAKAIVELAKDEKNSSRKMHAQKRLMALSPGSMLLTAELESYAAELGRIANREKDSVTAEDARARVDSLRLGSLIAAEKMPKLPAAIAKTSERKDDGLEWDPKTREWVSKKSSVTNQIAPDVERALKAAGWTKIEGSWKKVAENVYEVTDGRLEAAIQDGMLRVVVHREGGDGIVKAMVRVKAGKSTKFSTSGSDSDSYSAEGYGAIFEGGKAGMYGSNNAFFGTGSDNRPNRERTVEFPAENKKNNVLITVKSPKDLKITFDDKAFNNSERIFNNALEREGPFVIEVKGTARIESPQCARQ